MSPTRIGVRGMSGVLAALAFVAVALASAHTGSVRAQQATQTTGDTLYVVAFVDLTPDNAAAGTKALQQYVSDTRKDSGVVRIEAVAQDSRKNHLVLLEVWRNQKAFDAHESASQTKAFRANMAPLMGAPFDQRLHHLVP